MRDRSLLCSTAFIVLSTLQPAVAGEITHGPMVGHVTESSAMIWVRLSEPGECSLFVDDATIGKTVKRVNAHATAERDNTVVFSVDGLRRNATYNYRILHGEVFTADESQRFRTAPVLDDDRTVRLAFGSCAWNVSHPQQPVWTAIERRRVDAVILMGDTPYIDSTDLAVQRQRYRDFWSIGELKSLIRQTPVYAVWDDHDYGPDDALGAIPGRENSRRAFLEYHANPSYGEDDEGIFTSFRRGPVEVFLLDPRWFANTAASEFNPDRKTLLGEKQWKWLKTGLKKSKAAFKVLVSGMIWNEAAAPGKVDYWMAFPHEREGLFQFLKDERIAGVVLVAGDIHRSRHLLHPTGETVGYDLHEFISSPLAENVAPYNNIASPHLRYDAELEDSFLLMTVEQSQESSTLRAHFISEREVRHTVRIRQSELTPLP